MSSPGPTETRPYCYRCDKPESMCLCSYLSPLPNRVGIHVLQHPHERRHALGTARLLRLGLQSVRIHRLGLQGRSAACAPVELPEGAGLLYLAPGSRELATLPTQDQPRHLVVIDGTWTQAHRLYRDNPWISALPSFSLAPETGSRYRIRVEPRQECLSTLESVVAALRVLQPELEGTETLLAAFDAMIDAQIEASARESNRFHAKRARRAPSRSIPAAMLAPRARIVVVYAEAATRPMVEPDPVTPVRLSAVSLDGTRVFDQWLQTRLDPEPYLANQMGFTEQASAAALPYREAVDGFHAFCLETSPGVAQADPPEDELVLVAWNVWTHRWLEDNSCCPTAPVQLKRVWANLSQSRVPTLDDLVSQLGLTVSDLAVTGRAGRRLPQALAMTRHIVAGAADAA